MSDQPSQLQRLTEEQQQLRRKARRRLIGAVALVLLMVIVLPMVLDHEPKPLANDVRIDIPDQDSNKLPPLAVPSPTTATGEAVQSDAPASSVVTPLPKEALAEAPSSPAATVKQAKPEAVKPEATKPAPKPAEAKPAEAKQGEDAIAALARSKESQQANKPASATADAKSGKPFAVQFAALNDGAKAKELLQKLSHLGIKAFVVTSHTAQGEFSKVRAGPFKTREEADKVKQKASAAGLPAFVVAQ